MKVLITGSGGLVGFEACKFFLKKKAEIIGIDNNLRKYFFGKDGDISKNIKILSTNNSFKNYHFDLRDTKRVINLFRDEGPFHLIIHTAAQPSHDWAAKEPFTDFDVNARATLNLLEAFKRYSSEGTFILTSTNKVYGDNPNKTNIIEKDTRYEFAKNQNLDGVTKRGINENMSIDQCKHSLFGSSKLAADILCQEYGKYFGLNTGIFRAGCITGPHHSAVELHGFLAHIINCAVNNKPFTIFGYKGKQVRDQIHSYDVVRAFYEFFKKPKKGEVYNIGGTKKNAASILEIINTLKENFGYKLNYTYTEKNRKGDHICYYTDMSKFKKHYLEWGITKSLKEIISEIIEAKQKWKQIKKKSGFLVQL